MTSQKTESAKITCPIFSGPLHKEWFFILALLVAFLAGCGHVNRGGDAQWRLSANGHPIRAEVAATRAAMKQGLMLRPSLGRDNGMLFDYGAENPACIWMKDTLIPLSVAFVDSAGVVVDIADMAPGAIESRCSRKSVRYALEMNQGWFAVRGITPGSKIDGLP